jgi:SAM-dependent methyltransferase
MLAKILPWLFIPLVAFGQATQEFQPYSGQPGKDVVWVPTPPELVEKMLDMAKLTSKDYVIDLGSGDGRNVIAAAKRGAHGHGVEYNPDMVALSRRTAEREGVADKARFIQGDMYAADISKATVLPLFLLPENLRKLKPKFLALRPGTRIVTNGYEIDGWDAEEVGKLTVNCTSWCTAYLYIVPPNVAGTWRLPEGSLRLEQDFRRLSGTLTANGQTVQIAQARLSGARITFTAGMNRYEGLVSGREMRGTLKGRSAGHWKAVRAS